MGKTKRKTRRLHTRAPRTRWVVEEKRKERPKTSDPTKKTFHLGRIKRNSGTEVPPGEGKNRFTTQKKRNTVKENKKKKKKKNWKIIDYSRAKKQGIGDRTKPEGNIISYYTGKGEKAKHSRGAVAPPPKKASP